MKLTRHQHYSRPLEAAVRQFLIPSVERGVLSAEPVHERTAANMRAATNVHSIGIGFKRINGKPDSSTTALRFFVIQKLPEDSFQPELKIPSMFEGMPTDIIESPPVSISLRPSDHSSTCSVSSTIPIRPLVSGLAIAAPGALGSGALGWFCRSTRPGEGDDNFVLSNWHVLTNYGSLPVASPIHQPPASADHFAVANSQRVVPLLPYPQPNFVDAGIAKLYPAIPFNLRVRGIGAISSSPLLPTLGMRVRKFGPMSCDTTGVITDFPFLTTIQMTIDGQKRQFLFSDQLRIVSDTSAPFSIQGDSGSLILEAERKRPVALLFGLETGDGATYASPMDEVCKALEIELS